MGYAYSTDPLVATFVGNSDALHSSISKWETSLLQLISKEIATGAQALWKEDNSLALPIPNTLLICSAMLQAENFPVNGSAEFLKVFRLVAELQRAIDSEQTCRFAGLDGPEVTAHDIFVRANSI